MSELESILNYLETTSMEPHDDYTSEFSYKEQKVLWQYIKELQQKNQKYKEVIDKAIMYVNSTRYSDINGLQKYSIKEFWFIKELEDILKEVG